MITRVQMKMARAALGWGVRDLAKENGLAINTISRIENGHDAMGETLTKIQKTLEAQGIDFMGETAVDCRRALESSASEPEAQ
jgi:transcriptional regulator with XRE-family HTH domain